MVTKRLGIDLGTAHVLVYERGRGIVLEEPAVVALTERDNTVVAVGREAYEMIGRHPGSIQVIRPMRDGAIADYLITEALLRYLIGEVMGRFRIVRPEVMVSTPYGVTRVEQRAVRAAAEAAGARRPAHLIRNRSRQRSAPRSPSARRAGTWCSTSVAAAPRPR